MPKRIRKVDIDEKKYPGFNGILWVPIRFSASNNKKTILDFSNFCEEHGLKKNETFEKMFYNFYKVNNIHELLQKYPNIRRNLKTFKGLLLDEVGIRDNFSSWFESTFEKEKKLKMVGNEKK